MNKNMTISFRVTEQEYHLLTNTAKAQNMNISSYIVHRCLDNISQYNSESNNRVCIITDMRKLLAKFEAGLLKKKNFIKEMRNILNGTSSH